MKLICNYNNISIFVPMEKQKEKKFLLRIDKDLKEKITKKAEETNRSLNSQIITAIQNDLKEAK